MKRSRRLPGSSISLRSSGSSPRLLPEASSSGCHLPGPLYGEMKNTTVYVTHDQAEAVSLCDRMVILHRAELQQIGTVEEIWNTPANRFVAHFVGEPAMNFISARTEGAGSICIATPQGKRLFAFDGKLDPRYVDADVT